MRTLVRSLVAAVLLAVALVADPLASPAQAAPSIEVDRQRVDTRIGAEFDFATTIANPDAGSTPPLVAHLNILSLDPDVYVDPEDWSGARTRYLDPVSPGESVRVEWNLQAVNSGRFLVYVAVTEHTGSPASVGVEGGQAVMASPALHLDVVQQRTLNQGGALPLAAGVPAAVLAVLVLTFVRRRAKSRPVTG